VQTSPAQDEQEIEKLYQAADQALMRADARALAQFLAEDYVQYGDSGLPFDRQQILESLGSGAVQYPSIVSTGRTIRLFGDIAVVHGSEDDEVVAHDVRSRVRYLYMDVLMKRAGRWQLVASQLAQTIK
jgi:uncharacterized protein (TIGR02246 family)